MDMPFHIVEAAFFAYGAWPGRNSTLLAHSKGSHNKGKLGGSRCAMLVMFSRVPGKALVFLHSL